MLRAWHAARAATCVKRCVVATDNDAVEKACVSFSARVARVDGGKENRRRNRTDRFDSVAAVARALARAGGAFDVVVVVDADEASSRLTTSSASRTPRSTPRRRARRACGSGTRRTCVSTTGGSRCVFGFARNLDVGSRVARRRRSSRGRRRALGGDQDTEESGREGRPDPRGGDPTRGARDALMFMFGRDALFFRAWPCNKVWVVVFLLDDGLARRNRNLKESTPNHGSRAC